MFNKLSIKKKLWILVCISLLSTITITVISIFNVNKINNDLIRELNDEGFKPIALILNADRDMYQALSALQNIWFLNGSNQEKTKYIEDYMENIKQTKERVDAAENLLEIHSDELSTFKHSVSGRTIFEHFDNFHAVFSEWVRITDSYIQEGNSGKSDNTGFEESREDLNYIGELIEMEIGSAIIEAEKSKSAMTITIVAINIVVLLLVFFLSFILLKYLTGSLKKVTGALNEISNGNLNTTIDIAAKDEIGIMAEALRKMSNNLNDIMHNINTAARQVASGSKQVSDSSMALSQGATEQASSVEELTASLEQISAQTRQNAANANQANEMALVAKGDAVDGNERMKEMLKAMNDINEASSNIAKIIKVIDEIAFQTNILALNAAVEAARAGQHGKGFAVVAEEVRNLAARSANAAKETTVLIEGSIKKAENGTKIASETAGALNKIVDIVAKAANLVGEIATASSEQAIGIAQINQGIMQVSQVVQTNSATSQESASASEELSSQAEMLNDMVSKFKLKNSTSNYENFERLNSDVLKMLENMNEMKMNSSDMGKAKSETATKPKIVLSDNEFGKY